MDIKLGIDEDFIRVFGDLALFFKVTVGLLIRVCIGKLFSLFLIQNICCGSSKGGSFEHPKHMFKLMGKKIIKILRS